MKRIFAFVVLVVILGLSGCTGFGGDFIKIGDQFFRHVREYINPNRPLPPQPQVPAEVRAKLAAKSLQKTPISIGSVTYYDGNSLIDKINKKQAVINFTKEASKLSNPSAEVVLVANGFLEVFKQYLKDNGFSVVDESCAACLRLDVDFATLTLNADSWTPITIILARTRVFYGNKEILETRDDRPGFVRKAPLGPDVSEIAKHAAAMATTEELVQAWTIAVKGQQVSETAQATKTAAQ